jgi:hypothetical protein
MCIVVVILAIKKKAAASLRVQVPEQYAETALGQEACEIDGCGGFANASLDVINCDLFQKLKLRTKP